MIEQIKKDLISCLLFRLDLPASAEKCFECEITSENPSRCRFTTLDKKTVMEFYFDFELSLNTMCLSVSEGE